MEIWGAFVGLIESALNLFDQVIRAGGIPYPFGFAIILFTLVVKLVTMPLTFQQLRASKAMQELQPQLKELQKKYKDDKEKLAQAQMDLYKQAGVNPLGGCLPMLIQMPIWIGLYQALFNLAKLGTLQEGFFWIPSLAEPKDLSWIWPLPTTPDKWLYAAALLVLPILTVISQVIVQKMMTPANADPQQSAMNQSMMIMPFMFGFFSLQVPQGLVLYWVTSNIFALIQQLFVNRWMAVPIPSMSATPVTAEAAVDKSPVATKGTKKDAKRKGKR
jgi:YidC/Oxa1 family membrane protein insertase